MAQQNTNSSTDARYFLPAASMDLLVLRLQREQERRDKARIRMARTRAELKLRPVAEQEEYATRARAYQATYREKSVSQSVIMGVRSQSQAFVMRNRKSLKDWEAQRRVDAYIKKFGVADYLAYKKKKDERKRAARDKRRAKEQAVLEHTYPYDGPRAGRLIVD
ncbi:hypothetical protein B0H13DRAFT_1850705 [Mycena leptocephala]|nr:hypothetical protein B0H13DRAFT_1850705 [Mycena leptocephala]